MYVLVLIVNVLIYVNLFDVLLHGVFVLVPIKLVRKKSITR